MIKYDNSNLKLHSKKKKNGTALVHCVSHAPQQEQQAFKFGQKMKDEFQLLEQLANSETFGGGAQAAASAAGRQSTTHTHSYLLYVVARFRTSLNKHYI